MLGAIGAGQSSSPSAQPRSIRVAYGALGGTLALAIPIAMLAVPISDTVAVIGSPHADANELTRIVAAAGGSVLNLGGRPNIIIAHADAGGFVGRLYGAGARLVLDGRLAPFCGRPLRRATPSSRPAPGLGTPAP